jgi:hypothetical protein
MVDLLHGLKVFDIPNDFHPFIMNGLTRFVQTHLMLETRGSLQTHFILEEADSFCFKMQSVGVGFVSF